MLRRRFMFNSCRWLWRKITESVILKSVITKALAIPVKLNNFIKNPDKNVALTANDVSDLKINRSLVVSKIVTPRARLRADPVFIRDVTIYKIYKAITALAKLCKFIRNQTVKRVSNLIMCLTYLTSYKAHIIPILIANGIKADTVAVKGKKQNIRSASSVLVNYSDTLENVSINSIVPIDTHYAKIVCWINPILENGVLTILQTYHAQQTDDILKLNLWIDLILDNNLLIVEQAYEVN